MIERTAKNTVINWIEHGKDALLITGARQIGKTYLIRECLELSKIPYIELNFIDNPELVDLFANAKDTKDLTMRLSLTGKGRLESGKTIIFLDEIQEFKEIVTRIKFLVEEGSYRYILSGYMSKTDI